ncbi:PREDICTED: uncharacterized protein LOC108372921 [Rhagoletis zephyria]|uniref:uncharacterized protein LOC108372921 n=1 Tax=Rhagoletis zephyria TaxID=28612 RepID=UPI0008116100|nr:PREDICTED: uncharacterized protein LOC108372921 [Rhagoletis zephyria]XP_036322472.1 uncharacterized protein LOC118736503 isoform X2 [Rhagoletis pomonella]
MVSNSPKSMRELSDEDQVHLCSLRKMSSIIIRNILSMKQRISDEEGEIDTSVLECRLQIVESYFQRISEVHNNVEILVLTDVSRTEIEEIYIEAKSKLLSLINSRSRATEFNSSVFNATSYISNPHQNRLPTLKLPKFDGKYANYKRFFRAYSNMDQP